MRQKGPRKGSPSVTVFPLVGTESGVVSGLDCFRISGQCRWEGVCSPRGGRACAGASGRESERELVESGGRQGDGAAVVEEVVVAVGRAAVPGRSLGSSIAKVNQLVQGFHGQITDGQ